MTIIVLYWDTFDDSSVFLVCKGKFLIENTNGKCHVFIF